MYSSLFSSVTFLSLPPGTRSWVFSTPRVSWSTEKYISRSHSSMLFSLRGGGGGGGGGEGGREREKRREGGREKRMKEGRRKCVCV